MKNFLIKLLADFNDKHPIKKMCVVIIVASFVFTAMQTYFAYASMQRGIEPAKEQIQHAIEGAEQLANQIIQELRNRPAGELPIEFRDVFATLDFEPILAAIDYSGVDMEVTFSFCTNKYDSAVISSEIDYDVGEYRITSDTALVVVRVLEKALQQKLSALINMPRVEVRIVGVADGIPVKPGAVYRGKKIPELNYYYVNEERWKRTQLVTNRTPLTNELFAALRAYYAAQYMHAADIFSRMPIEISAKTTKDVGIRKCTIGIQVTVKDALDNIYRDFSGLEKVLFHLKYD